MDPDFTYVFASYVPLLDPDAFSDPAFYRELEAIGFEQVLLGGTGSAGLVDLIRAIKDETTLSVALYPSGPDSVCDVADVVLMPDVMNSNSHFARPFGSGSVATAMNIMKQGAPFLPVAYLILGNSTARWYFDAFTLPRNILVGYAMYARMVGYRYIALDYEDPEIDLDPGLIAEIREVDGLHLVVSDEFTPKTAVEARELGVQTIVTPSDILESASDPLALAAEFHAHLLR